MAGFYRLSDEDAERLALDGRSAEELRREEDERAQRWPSFDQLHERDTDWVVPNLIPRGMVSFLGGMPGIGKSMLTCRWAAQLSHLGQRTVLASAEDDPERSIKPRLRALEANQAEIVYASTLPFFSAEKDRTDWDWLVTRSQEARADLVVFDPFTAMIDAKSSSHNDQMMRLIIAPLAAIAESLDVAIVYVLHTNKAQHSELLYRVGGSVALTAAARSGLLMTVDKEDPRRRIVAHIKCNVGQLMPAELFEVEPIFLPPLNGYGPKMTARLRSLGLTDKTLEELFAPAPTPEERTERDRAAEFLLYMLGNDLAVTVNELKAGAEAWGVSWRTVERARADLPITPFQEGRKWHWRMSQS